jgi:hypothetical protein
MPSLCWWFCDGCRCNAICTIDVMGSDDRCAHRRWSSSIRGVVSGCIAAAAAVKVGARHGRVVDFRSCEVRDRCGTKHARLSM